MPTLSHLLHPHLLPPLSGFLNHLQLWACPDFFELSHSQHHTHCPRPQGFPDRLQLWGSVCAKYRQVGNAVPPPLSAALGRKLREALDEGVKVAEELEGKEGSAKGEQAGC